MKKRSHSIELKDLIQTYRENSLKVSLNTQEIKVFEDVLSESNRLVDQLNGLKETLEDSNLSLVGEDISKSTHDFNLEIKYMLEELSAE